MGIKDGIAAPTLTPFLRCLLLSLHPNLPTSRGVIIIPACRHVAPASLLPPSEKGKAPAGTQPDYPINLLRGRGGGAREESRAERGEAKRERGGGSDGEHEIERKGKKERRGSAGGWGEFGGR